MGRWAAHGVLILLGVRIWCQGEQHQQLAGPSHGTNGARVARVCAQAAMFTTLRLNGDTDTNAAIVGYMVRGAGHTGTGSCQQA